MSNNSVVTSDVTSDLAYKTLLESTLAVPWCFDWATQTFTYVGPQLQQLFGWAQNSWRTLDDWANQIHPEDREIAIYSCRHQSLAGKDHEIDYRTLKSNGEYVWVRDVVRVLMNDDGTIKSLVGFIFDISTWKRQEAETKKIKKQLERYSYQDSLTDVANRRLFNETYHRYWGEAIEQQSDFSLILLDIDHFKLYNDYYGHLQGDECLKQVAHIMKQTFSRETDLVARFGGEEFIVILPQTTLSTAQYMAHRLLENIRHAKIPHARSPISECLTVSLGLKSGRITHSDVPEYFLNEVDQALYLAKQAGRNQFFDLADSSSKCNSIKTSHNFTRRIPA